jgi:hypothetical protein
VPAPYIAPDAFQGPGDQTEVCPDCGEWKSRGYVRCADCRDRLRIGPQDDAVLAMHEQHFPTAQIARRLGLHRSSVTRALQRARAQRVVRP